MPFLEPLKANYEHASRLITAIAKQHSGWLSQQLQQQPAELQHAEAPLTELYPRFTSFAALHAASLRAQKGKRYRPAVRAFNACIVHHALFAAIVPPLQKRFIATSLTLF